jgi:hypothetical protein
MAIHPISRVELSRIQLGHNQGSGAARQEEEWFTDSASGLVGVILFDSIERVWCYTILAPAARGQIRGCALDCGIESREHAVEVLKTKMEEILATGGAERALTTVNL